MSDYLITAETYGENPGYLITRGTRTYDRVATREAADAKVAEYEAADAAHAAKVAALKAGYEAAGLRLLRSSHGLPKFQIMRGMTRWLVLDADDQIVEAYKTLDEVPAMEVSEQADEDDVEMEQATEVETATVRGTITDAQVATITDLIHDGAHEEGGYYAGPTSREGILALSREDAAHYIASMTEEY